METIWILANDIIWPVIKFFITPPMIYLEAIYFIIKFIRK